MISDIFATDGILDEEILSFLLGIGVGAPRVVGAARGTQSECWMIADGHREPTVVFKRFREPMIPGAPSIEFEALTHMWHVAQNGVNVITPEPLLLRADGSGYLMRFVAGQPLVRFLAGRDASFGFMASLSRSLVSALTAFHEASRGPFGDFHHSNVLIDDDGRPVLLDPTLPRVFYLETSKSARYGFVAADIGYWTYTLYSAAVRGRGDSRRHFRSLSRLTALLMSEGSIGTGTPTSAFVSDVYRVARRYATGLIRSGRMKSVGLGCVTWIGLTFGKYATRRHL